MKRKILIVDDDPDILGILTLYIKKEGYEVEATLNGKSLLKNMPFHPNLILLDRRLSGIDGLDICRHLKAQRATKDIPVIMISASMVEDKQLKDAGADDFLKKPFDLRQLSKKITANLR